MHMAGFSEPPETPRDGAGRALPGSTMARTGSLGRYALDLNGYGCTSDRLRQLLRQLQDRLAGIESSMKPFTAAVAQIDGWWIGWIEQVPGVNCQERTKDELLRSLRVTLREALEDLSQDDLADLGIG